MRQSSVEFGSGARAAMVGAAGLILLGCLLTQGFYSPRAVLLVGLGIAWGFAVVAAPGRWDVWLAPDWARRLLATASPAGLLAVCYELALLPLPPPAVVPLAVVALLACAAGLLGGGRRTPLEAVLTGWLLAGAGLGLLKSHLFYSERYLGVAMVSYGWMAAILTTAALLLPAVKARGPLALAWLLALGLAVRGGAVIASPDPVIDVHAWLEQAPRELLRGRNPYAMWFDSPYGTARARLFRIPNPYDPDPPFYSPGTIVAVTPAALLHFDPRWILTAIWLLMGVAVWRAARRRAPDEAGLVAASVLLMPSASFTIEQSWVDVIFTSLFLAGLVAGGRWQAPLFGLALAAKQQALYLVPAMLAALRRRREGLAMALACAAVLLPFLVWDPAELLEDLVTKHLAEPLRANGLTLPVYFHHAFGSDLPTAPLLLLAAALAGWAAWRARGSRAGVLLAGGLGLAIFSYLNRFAYLNYYEGACLLILAGSGVSDRRPEEAP